MLYTPMSVCGSPSLRIILKCIDLHFSNRFYIVYDISLFFYMIFFCIIIKVSCQLKKKKLMLSLNNGKMRTKNCVYLQ